jgi:hypothetical protein
MILPGVQWGFPQKPIVLKMKQRQQFRGRTVNERTKYNRTQNTPFCIVHLASKYSIQAGIWWNILHKHEQTTNA